MSIPSEVANLINKEQKEQNGAFIPEDPAFLTKLANHAELVTHRDSSGVVGYVFFYCNAKDKDSSYITLIGTDMRARGTGVAASLLKYVLHIAKQRGFNQCQLEVKKTNVKAFNFYKRNGFTVAEDRKDKLLMSILIKEI